MLGFRDMTRSPSTRRSATMLLVAAVLIGQACGGPSQPSEPTASAQLRASGSAPAIQSIGHFDPMVYPLAADAECDQLQSPDVAHGAYTGLIRRIKAIDARTVQFEACAPDVAFPARLALAGSGINDTAWLTSHIDPSRSGEQAIVGAVNGTGPYRLEAWNRGSDISLVRNDAYWGEAARNERLIVRWRDDPAGRLADLQAGSVDGIDDVAAADLEAIESDVALQAIPRPGLNVFYMGFNRSFAPFDNVKVRQAIALGIDRKRIVETLYPPGSEVASYFSPCTIPFGCSGDAWYEFDPPAAKQLLADAGFPKGFKTTIQYRDVARPYLPDPTAVAVELQAQLLATLDIQAELVVVPEDAFLTTVDEGRADGIHLLGRSASVPEVSALLDPHFGAGATKEFGQPIEPLVAALTTGAGSSDRAIRSAAYTNANNAIRANVPMIPIAHAGAMTAYRADIAGAQSSPVRQERFAAMAATDRRQFVWLASAEPDGLYCADETGAAAELLCSQLTEGLYAFMPGTASVAPALAEACKPDPELTIWTCTLRAGVTFHDGAALDANDVVLSFASQWDAEHPLHRGHEGRFQPFIDTFGGQLNPPA